MVVFDRSIQKTVCSPPFLIRGTQMAHVRKTKAGGIELTERQNEVLGALRTFIDMNGFPPTRADLGAMLDLKHQSSVDNHLYALARKGWIEIKPGVERGIALLREGVPLYGPGHFRRGSAILDNPAEPAREPEWIDYRRVWDIFGDKPDLCLWIQGNAMDGAGLTEHEIVALKRTREGQDEEPVQAGTVVAARVRDNVVVRRYHPIDEKTVELRPQSTNREQQTMRIDTTKDDMEIIGVAIGRIVVGRIVAGID